MRRVSRGGGRAAANRGARGRGRSAARSPSSPSQRTGSTSPSAYEKPLLQLRSEARQLEDILNERKSFYLQISGEADALTAVLASRAGERSGTNETANGDRGVAPPMSEEEEIAELTRRNAQLRRELKAAQDAELFFGNDPRVLDKRNEVKLVKMQIAEVEANIDTLETVKRRRDRGLREIDRTEQQVRAVRGRQREVNSELRVEMKELTEQLRIAEKADVNIHERHAQLQEQVKLGVTDEQVDRLREVIELQQAEIEELQVSEAEWRKRRDGAGEENQRILVKEQKECARLELEVERMRAQLIQKEAELRKSYQPVGRTGYVV